MLANKHPNVKPSVKLGLKNTNKFNNSENLNCANWYDKGPHAIVTTAYKQAMMPFRAILLTVNRLFNLSIKFRPIPF